jgi:hypothetical protein
MEEVYKTQLQTNDGTLKTMLDIAREFADKIITEGETIGDAESICRLKRYDEDYNIFDDNNIQGVIIKRLTKNY